MNFENLKNDIEEACIKIFNLVRANNPDEKICGYALYSDAGAMTIIPATNTYVNLVDACEDDPGDSVYYKWTPGEWSHEAIGAEFFSDISKLLLEEAKNISNQKQYDKFSLGVYQSCVEVLEKLRENNFFEKDSVVVFTISDGEMPEHEIDWIFRLNSERESQEFKDWILSL